MGTFLFELALEPLSPGLIAVIPHQRTMINGLLAKGALVSYSVHEDRSKLWCTINATSAKKATAIVAKFPIYPFCTQVVCSPLLFHNGQSTSLPPISLN